MTVKIRPAASGTVAALTIPSTRSSTYTGLCMPRPPPGSTSCPAFSSRMGSIVQGRDRGPYTSPGRTIVHGTSPSAWAASTTCSLAIFVST